VHAVFRAAGGGKALPAGAQRSARAEDHAVVQAEPAADGDLLRTHEPRVDAIVAAERQK
jgi:hypothetical protein